MENTTPHKQLPFLDSENRELFDKDIVERNGIFYVCHYDVDNSTTGATLISCTDGYIHNPTQKIFSTFKKVGDLYNDRELVHCD